MMRSGKTRRTTARSRTGLLRRRWWSQVPGSEVFIIDTPGARPRNRTAPRNFRNVICDFGALILLCLTDDRANRRVPNGAELSFRDDLHIREAEEASPIGFCLLTPWF